MDKKCQICNQNAYLSEGIADCAICKKKFHIICVGKYVLDWGKFYLELAVKKWLCNNCTDIHLIPMEESDLEFPEFNITTCYICGEKFIFEKDFIDHKKKHSKDSANKRI